MLVCLHGLSGAWGHKSGSVEFLHDGVSPGDRGGTGLSAGSTDSEAFSHRTESGAWCLISST